MSRLGSHLNTHNTCLVILRNKGFSVSICRENKETEIHQCLWEATKDGYEFIGDNPIELLGLVAVYEAIKPKKNELYWWQLNDQDVYQELVNKAYPECIEGEESN